jgi:uncharacterized protein YggE
MVDLPVVVVRGEAQREVPPEQAVFSVTVSAREPDRQTTLARLAERAAALRRLLDGFPDAIEGRETDGVDVHPRFKRGGERITGYNGSVTTTVTVSDFEVLGDLLLRLAGEEQTSISGPWWRLRPGSTAGADVRRAAIADALSRARDYADAVGSRVQRLIEIADAGTEDHHPMFRAMNLSAGSGGSEGGPELEVDPQPQTVQATVVVRVEISAPASLV